MMAQEPAMQLHIFADSTTPRIRAGIQLNTLLNVKYVTSGLILSVFGLDYLKHLFMNE